MERIRFGGPRAARPMFGFEPERRTIRAFADNVDGCGPARADCGGVTTPGNLADRIRGELQPSGALEGVLVNRIIAACSLLLRECRGEAHADRDARRAEWSIRTGLGSLRLVRGERLARATDPETTLLHGDSTDRESDWRDRLTMDATVSEVSPIIRGTWITVDQVINRVIDGWNWDDLLRSHPELTVEDIRACLAYKIEEEDTR